MSSVLLDTQMKIADVWLQESFKVVCEIKCHLFTLFYIVISCGSDFLDFVHISAFCFKRAITMAKRNHRRCMWPYTVYITAVFRGTHTASWSMGTRLKQLRREADNSALVRRLRMHEAFPPHLHVPSWFCTGAVLLSPVCNWSLLVTASFIRRW